MTNLCSRRSIEAIRVTFLLERNLPAGSAIASFYPNAGTTQRIEMTQLTESSTYLVANIHIFGYSHIYLPLLSTQHNVSTSLTFCYFSLAHRAIRRYLDSEVRFRKAHPKHNWYYWLVSGRNILHTRFQQDSYGSSNHRIALELLQSRHLALYQTVKIQTLSTYSPLWQSNSSLLADILWKALPFPPFFQNVIYSTFR